MGPTTPATNTAREIELKILLSADQASRLRRNPLLKSLGLSPARTQPLLSLYFDTEDRALRRAGIALRLRRIDGVWVQTVKKSEGPISGGFSQPIERECVVPRRALALGQILDHDLREEVIGLARAGLVEVSQTRFRRTARRMRSPLGGVVELAIDSGHVIAGESQAPFIEAELELIEGTPADLYALGEQLFRQGPLRFSERSKSGRAALLAETGSAIAPLTRRKAIPVTLPPKASVEEAAHLILSEGLAHASANLPLVLSHDDINGPHQLRVGLRRLRSAISAFRSVLGRTRLGPLGDTARMMASEAGRLRDLDVLSRDLIAPLAARSPDDKGFARLQGAIETRRTGVRGEVVRVLSEAEATGFAFRMGGLLAARGWRDAQDAGQPARLDAPIRPFARKILRKRWRAVAAYGDRIADLTIDERHEMRKEIKKLRYLVDAFKGLYDRDDIARFMVDVKRLQKAFGALNDSAMAEMMLLADDAPGLRDALAQRAAGQVLGYLAARSDTLWPEAIAGWQGLAERKAFWR